MNCIPRKKRQGKNDENQEIFIDEIARKIII